MKACYVDTSVLGAYYCPEPLSEVAQAFLIDIDTPVISLLTEVEFFSLVAKKKRVHDFSANKARMILMEFQSHLETGYFRKIVPEPQHYLYARDMIGELKTALRSLDALHLAIAGAEKLPLVTADQIMAQAARQFKIKTAHLRI